MDFPLIFYEMIIQPFRFRKRKPYSLEDLVDIDPQISSSLLKLKGNTNNAGLTFQIHYGEETHDLISNGVNLKVTEENYSEF